MKHPSAAPVWFVLLFGLSGLWSRAETALGAGRGVVDEVVADTATLAPVRAPIPFTQFRYAHVDADENVTFIADDPFLIARELAEKTHGIYRSRAADGMLECVVGPDTVLPGAGDHAWMRGLQSDGASFVFHGRSRLSPDAKPIDGLYSWRPSLGLTRLVQTGADAPGGGVFERLGYGALDDGTVIFSGLDSSGRAGLFSVGVDGRNLVRVTDNAGGGLLPAPSDGLGLFWFQPWLRDGALAFGALDAAKREGVWFTTFPPPTEADAAAPIRPPTRLALDKLAVPDGVKLNYVETTSTSQGWIAFNAGQANNPDRNGYGGEMRRGATRYEGVFLVRGDTTLNLVDTETFIPGRTGETFADFDFWTACDNDRVVFLASGPKGFRGVYLYDAGENALYPVVTTDDMVDGLRPADFEVGARPLVGERCAVVVRFAPGQRIAHGVYLATLHRTGDKPLPRR